MTQIHAPVIQMEFLQRISDLIPKDTSLVAEISELLDISTDSAYRRLRGETLLSIEEILILCEHFNISFDAFSRRETGLVTFRYSTVEAKPESFRIYLESIHADLQLIAQSKNAKIIYAGGDIPVFHHYMYEEIACFKMFYWMRSIMNIPELEKTKFSFEVIPPEITEISKNIISLYSQVPSVEIWTDTTIQSTLKQIEYYWEAGMFEHAEDAVRVCDSLRQVIDTIQNYADNSSKNSGMSNAGSEDVKNYELYFSDIEITNNSVLVKTDAGKAVYLGHFSFYTMTTINGIYCDKTEEWLLSLIKRSTLLSGIAEKQRYQFFRKMFALIEELKKRIQGEI